MDAFPSGPSLGNILESYSPPPWLVQRKSENQAKVFRSSPGASPPHFGGRMRRAEGDSIGKGQTKGNQGRKASGGKSVSTPI